jgi:foldase protein PrsA
LARRPPGTRKISRVPAGKPEEKKPSARKTIIITSVVFLVIITVSIVVGLYFSTWKNLWSPVITVNDETIDMGYLIRRMKYLDNTDDVISMLTTLTEEEFIRQGAPRYGIEVTQEEIDDLLWEMARGDNETISEREFKEWYRNVLNEIQLSETEYREWIRTILLADVLNERLVEDIPTVAEQVHLHIITLASFEETEAAIARIEGGEEFAEIARELTIDEDSREQGGDTGWWPQGALVTNLGWVAFNLEIGELSDPVTIDEDAQIYAICMITEKQSARDIEEDKMEILIEYVFQEWLYEQWDTVDYQWLSLDGGNFDTYTLQWIALQLLK